MLESFVETNITQLIFPMADKGQVKWLKSDKIIIKIYTYSNRVQACSISDLSLSILCLSD